MFAAQEAETPAGKPVAVPIPVAPVVVCVIAVKGVKIHVGDELDAAVTVLLGFTSTFNATGEELVHPFAVAGIVRL